MFCLLLNMVKSTTLARSHFQSSNPPKTSGFSSLQSCYSFKRTLPFNTAFSLMVKNLSIYPQNKLVSVAEYLQRHGIHCEKDTNLFLMFFTHLHKT